MNENLKNKIDNITTKQEYDLLIDNFVTSTSPIRFEAIKYLQEKHPVYAGGMSSKEAYIAEQVAQGQAELKDLL